MDARGSRYGWGGATGGAVAGRKFAVAIMGELGSEVVGPEEGVVLRERVVTEVVVWEAAGFDRPWTRS
jgi:hypothetical protein